MLNLQSSLRRKAERRYGIDPAPALAPSGRDDTSANARIVIVITNLLPQQ